MFLLYYLVNLINFVVYINLNYLNALYLNFNRFNLIFKKPFNKITKFEKFILVFFYNNNWFFKSILSFSNHDKNIDKLRKTEYPLLNFFRYYNFASNYKFKKLLFLKKMYIFFKNNNFLKINTFKNFIIFQNLLNDKYFSFLNLSFNERLSFKNLIKLNYLFFFFNKFDKNKINFRLNLNHYNDWFNFNFNSFSKRKTIKIKVDKKDFLLLKKKKLDYIKKTVLLYTKSFNLHKFKSKKKIDFFKNLSDAFKNYNKSKLSFFNKINFSKKHFSKLIDNLPIRFSESSMSKFINSSNIKNYNFFYLRKNKIFNKGRYSRNRQLYRTGVYWCLWLNIIIVYGLYFFFYRFTFNFGYLWFGLFLIAFSTIFSRILKYKFYNVFYLYKEFLNLFVWFNLLFMNFFKNLKHFGENLKFNSFLNLFVFNKLNFFIYYFFKINLNIIKILQKKKDYGYVYIWKNYEFEDKSFLRYKSILNWFIQLYKVLTY